MFSKTVVALALASSALANVFITSPIGATTETGGQEATIEWQDDGKPPTLAEFGLAKFSIYAGNSKQQTLLQALDTSVDVSKVSSLTFTPDPSIGPESGEYFIRVESVALKDPNQPSIPALAFSSRFGLTGMTGQFDVSVSSQIAAQSSAGNVVASSPATSGSATTPGSLTNTAATANGTGRTTTRAANSSSSTANRSTVSTTAIVTTAVKAATTSAGGPVASGQPSIVATSGGVISAHANVCLVGALLGALTGVAAF